MPVLRIQDFSGTVPVKGDRAVPDGFATESINTWLYGSELRGIRPPIWRRLALPGRMTLGDLHHVIQAAMGWDDGHLHLFDIAGRHYGDPLTVDGVTDEE